jgi:hypothetical protein
MAVKGQIADVSEAVETELSEMFNKCVYCSLAADVSSDITCNAQMCALARVALSDFEWCEELLDMHPLQGQTKG